MSSQKVIVVTGANKGIGFGIVKGLCKRFDGVVYLTARNASKGEVAVSKLNELDLHPSYHQLDISDRPSVGRFIKHIKDTHGGIDILINNAGVQYPEPYSEPVLEIAKKSVYGNYGAVRDFVADMLCVMRDGGRIINTSSGYGLLINIPSEKIKKAMSNPHLTLRQLNGMVDDFIWSVKNNKEVQDGWGDDPYKVSKVFLTALTFVQQRYMDQMNNHIIVNCINPGYVNTDMTKNKGVLTVDQGAEPSIYAALDAPDTVKGSLIWTNKTVVDWTGPWPAEE